MRNVELSKVKDWLFETLPCGMTLLSEDGSENVFVGGARKCSVEIVDDVVENMSISEKKKLFSLHSKKCSNCKYKDYGCNWIEIETY